MSLKPFSWVQDRLREIVAENPDKTAQCQYFDDGGGPVCVVGHVLANLGVTGFPSQGFDSEGTNAGALSWPEYGVRDPGSRQAVWIDCLQSNQDCEIPWGEALALTEAGKWQADE